MTETKEPGTLHRRLLESRGVIFAIATTIVVAIGGLVEIVPMFTVQAGPEPLAGIKPLSPLEVAGRDIYIREGCYLCHSQMIRPMRAEVLRYGEWTRAGELQYDHPFLLGSRRVGPDLQRVGGKYPDAWHFDHMRNPRSTSPGSIMPTYPWLYQGRVDPSDIQASLRALRRVGVPYTEEEIANAPASLKAQGDEIVARLAQTGDRTESDREIIALIAYLQRLGIDGKAAIAKAASTEAGAGAAP